MRSDTEDDVLAAWRRLFGLDGGDLWHRVTVQHPHGRLQDYPGWYVAWRDAGVHVSAPSAAEADEVAALRAAAGPDLQEPEFWHAFGRQRGLELRGPAMHAYRDVDPGPAPGVVDLSAADLEQIRAEMPPHEWELHTDAAHLVGVEEDGRLVAAASLGEWDGVARDIGVVVVPDRRGLGLAGRVRPHLRVVRRSRARLRAVAVAADQRRLGPDRRAARLRAVRHAARAAATRHRRQHTWQPTPQHTRHHIGMRTRRKLSA